MRAARSKFLLCRPGGGLNDTLVQIEKCWRYCDSFSRTLIVDTSGIGIRTPFGGLFRCLSPGDHAELLPSFDLLAMLDEMSCRPQSLRGRIGAYAPLYDPEVLNYVDASTRELLTFDFAGSWPEHLLVHSQCSDMNDNGLSSVCCLSRLRLQEQIVEHISVTRQKLPSMYDAVHVRNTDMKTDYASLFSDIISNARCGTGNLLLCTDDITVVDYAREALAGIHVYCSNSPPRDLAGVPIHHRVDLDPFESTRAAVTDLVLMASAVNLFYAKTATHGGVVSGFSSLASLLHSSPDLVQKLLGGVAL